MIPTPDRYHEKRKKEKQFKLKKATVWGINPQNDAILMFAGDTMPSKKTYKAFVGYVPQVGDLVFILEDNYIMGGVRN